MKYSIPKEILVAFLTQLNYDYHFTIRELGNLDRLGEITEKYTTLEVKIAKEVKFTKLEKKIQKPYPTDYNLLIAQDLFQTCYQILLRILLNQFIKLNLHVNMTINMQNVWN